MNVARLCRINDDEADTAVEKSRKIKIIKSIKQIDLSAKTKKFKKNMQPTKILTSSKINVIVLLKQNRS